MGSHGIKDRVAIVGMSCTPFREHFDLSRDDLLINAADQVLASVGVTRQEIDAYWLGMAASGSSGIVLASALKLEGKPVTRVENYCATGSEALRQASYAVASGAYDIAMAIGCDKFKDTGFAGTNASLPPNDGTARTLTAAAHRPAARLTPRCPLSASTGSPAQSPGRRLPLPACAAYPTGRPKRRAVPP